MGDFLMKITQSQPINNNGGGIEDAAAVIIYGFSAVLRSKTAENPFFESTRCSKFGMTHVSVSRKFCEAKFSFHTFK